MVKTRHHALLTTTLLVAGVTHSNGQLRVDFNSTSMEDGPNNQEGFESYEAAHELEADFTMARQYAAFGTTVSLRAEFPDSADPRTWQLIDRSAASDENWEGAWIDLLTDWIGIDTRIENGGNGDYNGTTGTPTRLLLRLGNLPAGDYTWRSYHHDTQDQNGDFGVELSTDGGSTFTAVGDFEISSSLGSEDPAQTGNIDPDPRNLPSTVIFPISVSGSQDVVVAFVPLSGGGISGQFFACNGFDLYDPANLPPGPDLSSVPQPEGSYAIDFGTDGSPVQSGFAAMLGEDSSSVTIHGTSFELTPNNLVSTFRPAVGSGLLSDHVSNPANNQTAGIVLRVTGLPAGEYSLESWHYDPDLSEGAIQIEKRQPPGFGNPITVLVDDVAFAENAATTSFTSDGAPFELVVREDSDNNETRWNGLWISSGSVTPSRPRSPWVFRTLMENRTRMLVAALHPNLWISYNPGNCCLDRAWSGGMQLHGKVYDESQRNSWISGSLYHRYSNSVFEATDEAVLPAGWTVDSGSVDHTSATQGTSFINPLRDKRSNRWFKFNGATTVTTGTLDLSRHRETILFFEERQKVGTRWNLLPGSGTLRVQVSEDDGSTWTSQDFFSTEANMENQFNFKEITSRSESTKLRFTSNGGQFANLTLEGEFLGWTATNSQGALALTSNWLGYRTLNRDEGVTLRYELQLDGEEVVSVEESPEVSPQLSGPPRLERTFDVSGIPAGTTVSLRLGGDPAQSTHTESWSVSGAGALRMSNGVAYLDLTTDGTVTATASWTP